MSASHSSRPGSAAAGQPRGIALRRRATDRAALVWLFALVREAASRSLGFRPATVRPPPRLVGGR